MLTLLNTIIITIKNSKYLWWTSLKVVFLNLKQILLLHFEFDLLNRKQSGGSQFFFAIFSSRIWFSILHWYEELGSSIRNRFNGCNANASFYQLCYLKRIIFNLIPDIRYQYSWIKNKLMSSIRIKPLFLYFPVSVWKIVRFICSSMFSSVSLVFRGFISKFSILWK